MAAKSRIISVSIEDALLERFDAWLSGSGIGNRSSGIQQLVRDKLEKQAPGDENGPAVATVTYVYDHHRRDLMERLAHLQHEEIDAVVATTHVHLDHERCLEVLILRGPAGRVRALGERIIATRGIESGEINLTAAAPRRAPDHAHAHAGPAWHAAAHGHSHDHEHPHGHEHRHAGGPLPEGAEIVEAPPRRAGGGRGVRAPAPSHREGTPSATSAGRVPKRRAKTSKRGQRGD